MLKTFVKSLSEDLHHRWPKYHFNKNYTNDHEMFFYISFPCVCPMSTFIDRIVLYLERLFKDFCWGHFLRVKLWKKRTFVAHILCPYGWKILKQKPSLEEGLSKYSHVLMRIVPTQWCSYWDEIGEILKPVAHSVESLSSNHNIAKRGDC